MLKLTQVTPTYPPDISGVGDYAALLGRALHRAGQPLNSLVARQEVWTGEGAIHLGTANAEGLAAALADTDGVLLHFSGYGYGRRGLCRWLVDGLRRWKGGGPQRRLVTMFHEVYASGPMWRSSFWTQLPQRQIAHDLAELSDSGFASSNGGLAQLRRLSPDLRAEFLPVFSNIGEPDSPRLLANRGPSAVVFGGVSQRMSVYKKLVEYRDTVARNLKRHGVTQLLDIGPAADTPSKIANVEILRLGILRAEDASEMLSECRVGFIDYPGHVFSKSGIAASYFAHRMLVVNTSPVGGFPSDLRSGVHLIGIEMFDSCRSIPQQIADSGHAWYLQHGLDKTAQKFQAVLR